MDESATSYASGDKQSRMIEAYRAMAKVGYRPAAPSDGFGHISEEIDLDEEAQQYVDQFLEEEESDRYYAGCTDWHSNRAAIFALEALRLMNAGFFWVGRSGGITLAPTLLRMAAEEYERELGQIKARKERIISAQSSKPGASFSIRQRFEIMRRDNWRCQLCGVSIQDGDHVRLEAGHRKARALGGTNELSNAITLCWACNHGQRIDEI